MNIMISDGARRDNQACPGPHLKVRTVVVCAVLVFILLCPALPMPPQPVALRVIEGGLQRLPHVDGDVVRETAVRGGPEECWDILAWTTVQSYQTATVTSMTVNMTTELPPLPVDSSH